MGHSLIKQHVSPFWYISLFLDVGLLDLLIITLVPFPLPMSSLHITHIMPWVDDPKVIDNTNQLVSGRHEFFDIVMNTLIGNLDELVKFNRCCDFTIWGPALPKTIDVQHEDWWSVVKVCRFYWRTFPFADLAFEVIDWLLSELPFQQVANRVGTIHRRERQTQIHEPIECVPAVSFVTLHIC